MDISGKPREGWMTVVPVTVFLLFVVVALGGFDNFVNNLNLWAGDIVRAVSHWFRSL